MWNRKDLKARGKESFKWNYWKSVLVALILSVAVGGASGAFSGGISGSISGIASGLSGSSQQTQNVPSFDTEDPFSDDLFDDGDVYDTYDYNNDLDDILGEAGITREEALAVIILIVAIIVVVSIIATVAHIFLFAPLEVGCRRFYFKNLKEKAELKELPFGYDNAYLSNVGTLFLRSLFVALWSLLFIIPGIIKSYEYRMIPYILAENPGITRKEAFAHSKMLMKGNKWDAFILDLSFIGWFILSGFTCGILAIFYVGPYYNATCAALYDVLEHGNRMAGMDQPPVDPTSMFTGMPPQQM